MKIRTKFSLQACNSFNIPAITAEILFPASLSELSELSNEKVSQSYILGEGTNTLFCQPDAPIIIKPNLKGIEVTETEKSFHVSAACAENWHEFVKFCIRSGIYGLENLALIPGSVGAAPVQNIGAYGIEVSDFIERVSWYDFSKHKLVEFSQAECQFGYRNSLFKQALSGKGIITHVHFVLPKLWQPVVSYQGLNDFGEDVTPTQIMTKVIELRQSKLPDPKQLPNAGSFFKNPVISMQTFKTMQQQYDTMPFYQQQNDEVKLAAGWLIEQTGLKGFRLKGVGVHEKQALVIVNYASNCGQDIVELAQLIQSKVMEKFGINLEPEVRFIGYPSIGCES